MKRIAILLAVVFGIGMLFSSSTCKNPKRIVGNPFDTVPGSGGTTPWADTTGQITISVTQGTPANTAYQPNTTVYIYTKSQGNLGMDSVVKHGNPMAGYFFTQVTTNNGISPYAQVILPTGTVGRWYWFYSTFQYNGNAVNTLTGLSNSTINGDSLYVTPCNYTLIPNGCKENILLVAN